MRTVKKVAGSFLLAVLFSCGGGNNPPSELTPWFLVNIKVIAYDGLEFEDPCRQGDIFDVLVACVYRDESSGKVAVSYSPVVYSVEATCTTEGEYEFALPSTYFENPETKCIFPPELDPFSSTLLDTYFVVEHASNDPFIVKYGLRRAFKWNGEQNLKLVLEPLSSSAHIPFEWWGREPTFSNLSLNLSSTLSYAGLSSYPDINTPADLRNFADQVRAGLGLPQDASFEIIKNAVMERRLTERNVSFGEYMSQLYVSGACPPTPLLWEGRVQEVTSIPSQLSPEPDQCTTGSGTIACLQFHNGKFAISYGFVDGDFVYSFYAFNEKTGNYSYLGTAAFFCPLFPFKDTSGNYIDIKNIVNVVCERDSLPFTIKCYVEDASGRTFVNYIYFNVAEWMS